MRRAIILTLATAALAACSREPRDASYFESRPEETGKVLAACAEGTHRGQECVNAKAADAAIRRKARMETYKKAF